MVYLALDSGDMEEFSITARREHRLGRGDSRDGPTNDSVYIELAELDTEEISLLHQPQALATVWSAVHQPQPDPQPHPVSHALGPWLFHAKLSEFATFQTVCAKHSLSATHACVDPPPTWPLASCHYISARKRQYGTHSVF